MPTMGKPVAPEERARRRASMQQLGEIRAAPPLPSDASDVEAAKHLLTWCRAQGIAIGAVVVGKVSIQVHDLGIRGAPATVRQHAPTTSEDIYAEYGGRAMDRFRAEADAYYEDDDEDEEEAPPPRKRKR